MEMTPPKNLEVEQSLIGSLMADNNLIPLISGIVKPEYFSDPSMAVPFCHHLLLFGKGLQTKDHA